MEYALGADAFSDSSAAIPAGAWQEFDPGTGPATYATLTFQRETNHEDAAQFVEFGTDLSTWLITGVLVSSTETAPGRRTEIWRSSTSMEAGTRLFGRVRFSQ